MLRQVGDHRRRALESQVDDLFAHEVRGQGGRTSWPRSLMPLLLPGVPTGSSIVTQNDLARASLSNDKPRAKPASF